MSSIKFGERRGVSEDNNLYPETNDNVVHTNECNETSHPLKRLIKYNGIKQNNTQH
jgi:hypothetical protein